MTGPKPAVLPITPQGNARGFYHVVARTRTSKPAILLCVAAALGCGERRETIATYLPTNEGLVVEAAVDEGERLLIFTGPPAGPSFPRTDGRVWTTVRADPEAEFATPVGSATRGADGAARAVVPWSYIQGDDPLLQALVVDEPKGPWASRVGACVVVRGRGAAATILPHEVALASSPHVVGPIVLLAVVTLIAFGRRRFGDRRPPRLVGGLLAAGAAAALVAPRLSPDPNDPEATPLFPSRPIETRDADDALDAATVAGFARLLEAARRIVPNGASVALRASKIHDLPHPSAVHAAARIFDRPIEFEALDDAPRAAPFVLGVAPARPRGGDVVLFANEAGYVAKRSDADATTSRPSGGAR
jgi:hypothetical protein